MDGARLAALAQRGYRIAAARIGTEHAIFRPNQTIDPVNDSARIGSIPATFDRVSTFPYTGWPKHTEAQRHGILDGFAVQHGDYLVPEPCSATAETVFVAKPGLVHASLCFACNATLDLLRPAEPEGVGLVGYRAPAEIEVPLLGGWPASLLASGRGGASEADLPGGVPVGDYTVLMPFMPMTALIRNGDVLQDAQGRRYAVLWSEGTLLGWRMTVRSMVAG